MYLNKIKYLSRKEPFLHYRRPYSASQNQRFNSKISVKNMKVITTADEKQTIQLLRSGSHNDRCLGDQVFSQPEIEILGILKKFGYDFGVTLPGNKIKQLIDLVREEPSVKMIPVTREEEGVGICAGAYLAGKKPFMLIQSSGLGNSLNALASLIKTFEIPLLVLASYRGYYEEKIPAQIPLGNALPRMLDALEIPFLIINKDCKELEKACEANINDQALFVVFLSPELFEDA